MCGSAEWILRHIISQLVPFFASGSVLYLARDTELSSSRSIINLMKAPICL